MKTHVNIGEMLIRGGELLFKSLFLKDSSTFIATVVLILFSPTQFSDPHLTEGLAHYISFLGYLHRTLVPHLNLYLNICLIKHLPWLSVNGDG